MGKKPKKTSCFFFLFFLVSYPALVTFCVPHKIETICPPKWVCTPSDLRPTTTQAMPIFARGWLCRELRVPAFVENGLPQWMEDHFMKTRPLVQDIHWIKRVKEKGDERCRGHSEAGHKCLHQVGLGRRGQHNQDDNAGFCYVCRAETDDLIRETTDSSIRQQLRLLKQATNYWPVSSWQRERFRSKETGYRNFLIEHRRKARMRIEEAERRKAAEHSAVRTKILELAKKQGIDDPIQYLIYHAAHGTSLAIGYFHDEYVAWNKNKDDYTEELCSICIEPCTDDEKYIACGHLFHKACIDKWNALKGCPNCRAKLC